MQTFWNELTFLVEKKSGQKRLNNEMSSSDTLRPVNALVGSQGYLVGFLLNFATESSKLLSAFLTEMLSNISSQI